MYLTAALFYRVKDKLIYYVSLRVRGVADKGRCKTFARTIFYCQNILADIRYPQKYVSFFAF